MSRRHLLEEGSLKWIWGWFFGPLTQYKPAQLDIEEWMETLWDTKNREITRYVARRDFQLPGLYCAAPLVRLQGLGKRKVRERETLWVRMDALNPNCIEVETVERAAQTFVLSRSEWNSIAAMLEEQE